jgi:hypothetical protein
MGCHIQQDQLRRSVLNGAVIIAAPMCDGRHGGEGCVQASQENTIIGDDKGSRAQRMARSQDFKVVENPGVLLSRWMTPALRASSGGFLNRPVHRLQQCIRRERVSQDIIRTLHTDL